MDGRRKLAILGLFVAAGCKSAPETTSGMPAPAAVGGGSKYSLFAPKPPGPVPQQPLDGATLGKKKGPLKPETIVAFADAQADAAFNNEDAAPAERDRNLDDARLKYMKALERDPKSADALRGLGRMYTRLGDREQAMRMYGELLRHHPQDHKAVYEMALAQARFEDWAGAEESCKRALAGDPQSLRYTRTLGLCVARTGRYQEAFDVMTKVMAEAEARTAMAKVFLDAGQPDVARQQLELAVAADPGYAAAREMLGQPAAGQPANGIVQTGGQ